jgi:hypothetical protein
MLREFMTMPQVKPVEKLLLHKSVAVRFIALYAVGLILFYLAWFFSYSFLPEGLLRGYGAAAKLAGDRSSPVLVAEWVKIVGINLFSCLLVYTSNWFMIKNRFPLGYLIPLQWFIIYGLLMGSNSFSIPLERAIAPSLAAFGRSGPYEIGAYALLAAATARRFKYRLSSFFAQPVAIESSQREPLRSGERIALLLAILVLLLSNLHEAIEIFKKA